LRIPAASAGPTSSCSGVARGWDPGSWPEWHRSRFQRRAGVQATAVRFRMPARSTRAPPEFPMGGGFFRSTARPGFEVARGREAAGGEQAVRPVCVGLRVIHNNDYRTRKVRKHRGFQRAETPPEAGTSDPRPPRGLGGRLGALEDRRAPVPLAPPSGRSRPPLVEAAPRSAPGAPQGPAILDAGEGLHPSPLGFQGPSPDLALTSPGPPGPARAQPGSSARHGMRPPLPDETRLTGPHRARTNQPGFGPAARHALPRAAPSPSWDPRRPGLRGNRSPRASPRRFGPAGASAGRLGSASAPSRGRRPAPRSPSRGAGGFRSPCGGPDGGAQSGLPSGFQAWSPPACAPPRPVERPSGARDRARPLRSGS
jgi:hypothetical protein